MSRIELSKVWKISIQSGFLDCLRWWTVSQINKSSDVVSVKSETKEPTLPYPENQFFCVFVFFFEGISNSSQGFYIFFSNSNPSRLSSVPQRQDSFQCGLNYEMGLLWAVVWLCCQIYELFSWIEDLYISHYQYLLATSFLVLKKVGLKKILVEKNRIKIIDCSWY